MSKPDEYVGEQHKRDNGWHSEGIHNCQDVRQPRDPEECNEGEEGNDGERRVIINTKASPGPVDCVPWIGGKILFEASQLGPVPDGVEVIDDVLVQDVPESESVGEGNDQEQEKDAPRPSVSPEARRGFSR